MSIFGGSLGIYGGIPIVENKMVPADADFLMTTIGRDRTIYVRDYLRFNVRWNLHEYIDRRVRETYVALGLNKPAMNKPMLARPKPADYYWGGQLITHYLNHAQTWQGCPG